jgi:hypothetical protein
VSYSPGYIDLQLNGGYGFDFSVYDGDESYKRGMQLVAERIVETGVTSYVGMLLCFYGCSTEYCRSAFCQLSLFVDLFAMQVSLPHLIFRRKTNLFILYY